MENTDNTNQDGQEQQLMGLRIYIYRRISRFSGNPSNSGISSRVDQVTLVGEDIPEIFVASDEAPAVRMVTQLIAGKLDTRIEPIDTDGVNRWYMSGGSYAYTCDERFPNFCPVPFYDRWNGMTRNEPLPANPFKGVALHLEVYGGEEPDTWFHQYFENDLPENLWGFSHIFLNPDFEEFTYVVGAQKIVIKPLAWHMQVNDNDTEVVNEEGDMELQERYNAIKERGDDGILEEGADLFELAAEILGDAEVAEILEEE